MTNPRVDILAAIRDLDFSPDLTEDEIARLAACPALHRDMFPEAFGFDAKAAESTIQRYRDEAMYAGIKLRAAEAELAKVKASFEKWLETDTSGRKAIAFWRWVAVALGVALVVAVGILAGRG